MKNKDTVLLEQIYSNLSVLEEKIVLRKKTLEDGNVVFVVDSDLEGSAAGGETFKNKDKIKGTGLFFFDKSNLRKWISKTYSPEEFKSKIPEFQKAVADINKDTSMKSFDELSADLEELVDTGMKDKISSFLEDLKAKLKEDSDSEEVKKFFEFRKKFRTYSLNNQMLIYIQKRDATHVAGKQKWYKEFGRTLKKGAKGIYIFVPYTKKYKTEGEEPSTGQDAKVDETRQMTRFMLKPVFDISDTEAAKGKEHMAEVPEEPKWWDDTPIDEKTKIIFDALMALSQFENIKVDIGEEGLGGARGVSRKGSIQLMIENISTFIHELAHEFLHGKEARTSGNSQVRELQAEGVAYVVLREFDLPTEHASKYLALWKIDPENIRSNEAEIQKAASYIIDYIYAYATDGESSANEYAQQNSLIKKENTEVAQEQKLTFKEYLLEKKKSKKRKSKMVFPRGFYHTFQSETNAGDGSGVN